MNTKKMTAFIVGAMLIATVLVMGVSAAGFDRSKYLDMPRMVYEFDAATDTGIYINDVDVIVHNYLDRLETKTTPTLRIYGEKDAIYPTHSYYDTNDFVYPSPVDPFDPGIIAKDSVTFDPAYVQGGSWVNNVWGDEKVFYRVFYEPGYAHGIDTLMAATLPDYAYAPVTMDDGALVTETTYMMVTDGACSSGLPRTGAAGVTRFELPTLSEAAPLDLNPGMDHDNNKGVDMVNLLVAEAGSALTTGTIEVGIEVHLDEGESVRFMDHNATLVEACDGTNSKFQISYIGNRDDIEPGSRDVHVPKDGSEKVYVNRYNNNPLDFSPPRYDFFTTDVEHRWFIRVTSVDLDDCNGCTVMVGRRLVAGETFYVDGVRYDMPAIYVTGGDEFKYITLQSPLPKCPSVDCNCDMEEDYSHVECQWLAMLCMSDPTTIPTMDPQPLLPVLHYVWVLPPFNTNHLKIDDINLAESGCPDGNITVNEAGEIFEYEDNPLEFYYIEEYIEERFDSSLAEMHYIRKDGVEIWNWWNVYTKPYQYTTLVLPDDETACETYACGGSGADGDEYIVTTSFIAPNSEADNRHADCKDPETHDIIDRAATIALGEDAASRDAYNGTPRMVFRYDAVNTDDLFVNNDGVDPTVRIYGEAGAIYPTHSMTGAVDFIYPNHVDPFDPGVIAKDSVTFNPAYIDHYYKGMEIRYWDDERQTALDGEEKVFLRAFYEPGYAHIKDSKMPGLAPVVMENGSLVTETTYMLTTDNDNSGHSGLPIAAGAQLDTTGKAYTRFILPTSSTDPNKPGMEAADLVELSYANGLGTDQLTDGEIDVEVTKLVFRKGTTVDFMDHRYDLIDITDKGEISLEVSYIGNMQGYENMAVKYASLLEDTRYWVTRSNGLELSTHPQRRPYFEITDQYTSDTKDLRIVMTLGRRLVAGETFYVDGVRYDLPAVYVTTDDRFKYITLQSPMPKCEDVIWYHPNDERNLKDASHVSSQWLANLLPIEVVPLLPPFNEDHTMIDDIDLDKDWNCGTWENISIDDEAGNILDANGFFGCGPLVDSLEFYYIAEKAEPRFDSSLAERLNSDGSTEIWNWWSIFTKPYQYTEIVLPDQEKDWMADGNEYLITTSFIAPNCEDAVRDMDNEPFCKPYDTHDIIDRASTLRDDPDPTCPWDLNGDKVIDVQDIVMVANHWGEDWPAGEFSGDNTIDVQDIVIIANHWGDCPA